mgnify:CR=1 FL=1|jgi:SpoVK/Ycf46/Vps4 family AAA+-type ATPase
MIASDKLKQLFIAYREHDDAAFHKVAESLIAGELVANHHSTAKDLKAALGKKKTLGSTSNNGSGLKVLPKDRRTGEDLIRLEESFVDRNKIFLNKDTESKISRVLEEHRRSKELARYGYHPKTKLLFWGLPGCGKTFTAKYLAYELGLPVAILQLSAVISSFVGDTASHLQRVFDIANRVPMVLLLDEIDAVGKNRDDPNDVGELKRVVNSLLQAMDSFSSTNSIVIAASNHQYLLDPALWRRFDDIVHFPLPSQQERAKYIQYLLNGIFFDGSLEYIAKSMNSIAYADIQRITVESIKTMILEGREKLHSKDITNQIKLCKNDIDAAKNSMRTASE